MNSSEYARRVAELEEEGICTSDAQAIVDRDLELPRGVHPLQFQCENSFDELLQCGIDEL